MTVVTPEFLVAVVTSCRVLASSLTLIPVSDKERFPSNRDLDKAWNQCDSDLLISVKNKQTVCDRDYERCVTVLKIKPRCVT